ncbi:hypothetical protein ACU4GA_12120 [Methylobacterium oryzae CBMB20]
MIGALLLLTQLGIAWVTYTDQLRLYDDRAQLLARLTAAAIARPDWAHDPDAWRRAAAKALAAEPDVRHAGPARRRGPRRRDGGRGASGRDWSTLSAQAELSGARPRQPGGQPDRHGLHESPAGQRGRW